MAAKLAVGIKPEAHLRRLAVVFAVELRLKIVGELYTRVMSPKQFYEEFGGGSISRVTKNFERLAETGWLREVRRKGPGGPRRGGIEHFYRATELAFFDAESWALVPYSLRVACSWSLFGQIALRVREALDRSVAELSMKQHDLRCMRLLLDETGWERVIEAIEAEFLAIFEEQKDAQIRAAASGESLMRADILLIAFESPYRQGSRTGDCLIECDKEPLIPFPQRLAPVLADDVSRQIVTELNRREMSVLQFHREFGGTTVGGIRRRFKRLEISGWLRKSRIKTGGRLRGATENFYLATKPAITDDNAWIKPSGALSGTPSWRNFESFSRAAKEAMLAGTFDRRLDRYVTLSFVNLDQQGWENVGVAFEALSQLIANEQKLASLRLAQSSASPMRMTVGFGAFETSNGSVKAP